MTPEQFEIFKLGFFAGRNAGMKRNNGKDDLEFWYKVFVLDLDPLEIKYP